MNEQVPNEYLAVIDQMAREILNLRKCKDYSAIQLKELSDEFETLSAKVAAKQATVESHEKTIELIREERRAYIERIGKIEDERDSARRKLYALAQAINCLHGCEKAKQPRLYLLQFAENVKQVIREQDIHLTPDGMAK